MSLRRTHCPGPQTQSHICSKPGDRGAQNKHTQEGMTNIEQKQHQQQAEIEREREKERNRERERERARTREKGREGEVLKEIKNSVKRLELSIGLQFLFRYSF